MANIIQVKNFTKKYGELVAVDNISFDVEEGSSFAFLGPNGAGKSTTINTLCTIQSKSEGKLIINGHDVEKQESLVRRDIGIVFQDSTLDQKLTVEQNLKLHCRFYHVPKDEVNDRINFVLKLVDLADWKKSPVGSLSGGMKRRVEISRGLIHFPKVLFLDEPTAGLDPQTRAGVWDYIKEVQIQKSITIFLTTHYMDEAEFCSSVAIIDHGKIVAYDTPDRLKSEFTHMYVRIKTNKPDELTSYLNDRSIRFDMDQGYVKAYLKEAGQTLQILCMFQDSIADFEVNKGSLNDVFLTVTGREIRE